MVAMHLFFSHSLTENQIEDATKRQGVSRFVHLPEELQRVWSNIPTELTISPQIIDSFINYLKQNSQTGDLILVQGDFGLTFIIVDWCLNNDRIPVYSTTARKVREVELDDGSVELKHSFKHVNFRVYRRL